MKLKAKRCECCGEAMTVIRNIEEYQLCGKCLIPKNIKTATYMIKNKGSEKHIAFITDCKHLDEDLQKTKVNSDYTPT